MKVGGTTVMRNSYLFPLFLDLEYTLCIKVYVFVFADEEGDLVAFSTDEELNMGLEILNEGVFRVYIKGIFVFLYCIRT